uniref:Cytochrome P450, family 46, subfamily A, polypeptide 1, tandem duplicate 4 n=1 Tax=Maylandia zebra TaxID=106582 RepID=A0A3P9BJH3_9CICH
EAPELSAPLSRTITISNFLIAMNWSALVHHIFILFPLLPPPPPPLFLKQITIISDIISHSTIILNGLHCCILFFGNGLVTARDHEQWYKQRRIMDPAFSSLYLRGLMGTFNERAEKLMDKLAELADNKTEANMLHLLNCVTLDVISKVAFGVDLDLLKNSSPFPKAIETCLKGMVTYVRDVFFEFNPKNRRNVNEVREACRLLRTTGAKWISERKTTMQNGDEVPKDILTQIIKTAKENMTEEDEEFMLDNFVTFFIAGQETTANQLGFCIMALGRHPEILEKAKKEVDDVIGMKRDISYDDLGELVYLSQVLKETLRIYPPAPGTSRDVAEDMVIDDIHIPGGFSVVFNSYVSGRLERFFKDPLRFDPERFHPDAPKPYYCYYPFALGPRSCLGQNFAQLIYINTTIIAQIIIILQ